MSYLGSFSILLICLGLVACGGGGASSSTPPINQQSSSQHSSSLQSSVMSSVRQSSSSTAYVVNPISRQIAPSVVSAFADALELSANFYTDINNDLLSYSAVPDVVQTINCDQGSVTVKISNKGRYIDELYKACQLDGVELDGEKVLEIVSTDIQTGAKINYSYKHLNIRSVSDVELYASMDGFVTYIGKVTKNDDSDSYYGDSDSYFSLSVDLTIDDAQEGHFEIKNFNIEEEYNLLGNPSDLSQLLARTKFVSGNVVVNNTRFTVEPIERGVVLKGDNDSLVNITRVNAYNLFISWDETGDDIADASLALPYKKDFSISEMIFSRDHKTTFIDGYALDNQIYEGAQIYMGRGGSADIYVHWNFTNTSASLLNYELNGKTTNGVEWTQLEAGHFKFNFPSNQVDTNYDLTFTATDTEGNKSPEIHAKIYVGTDTDKDGVPDVVDEDDDGDLTPDVYDTFPLNPKEDHDADGDGIGDNADPDSDFSVQRGFIWFVDKDGVVYFTANSGTDYEDRVQKSFSKRWDPKTNRFLDQLVLTNFGGYRSYYSLAQNRLYYLASNKDIYYVDLANIQETLFIKADASFNTINFLPVKSDVLVISNTSNMGPSYASYNNKGQLISSLVGYDSDRNAFPFYPPELVSSCSFYVTIDAQGNLYQHGNYERVRCETNAEPIWLANNLVVRNTDSFVLYSAQGVELKRYSLPSGAFIETVISNSNQLVFLLKLEDYSRKIVALDANLEFISEYVLPVGN